MSKCVHRVSETLSPVICLVSVVAICEMIWSRAAYHTIRGQITGLITPLTPPAWYVAMIPVFCVVGTLIAKGQTNDRSALAWKVVILIAVAVLWWFHARVVALQIDFLQM
jgi:hypothetical protein